MSLFVPSAPLVCYIDPGTGSMLFTLVIGILSAGYFFVRALAVRLKFLLTGGGARAAGDRMAYVIFSDDKRYWNVFEPVCDEFERRGIDLTYWTASPNDPALERDYEHITCEFIGEGNKAFARLNTMSADICIATTPGLDVFQWKRSKEVDWYVHMKHGVDTNGGYRMFGTDFYDAILNTGDYMGDEIRELEQLRGLPPKEQVTVGCTFMDTMMERRKALSPVGNGRKTVLLAPSWGPSALLSVYGARIIEALLATDYDVIVRPHPQTVSSEAEMLSDLMRRFPENNRLSWNFDNDNFDVLSRADIMVSDFSGVIYDYALIFDRPTIYAEGQFDPSVYDAAWFDHPLRKFSHFPLMGRPLREEMLPHMGEVLDEVLGDQELAEGRRLVSDEVWQHKGESARRVADYLVMARERVLAKRGGEGA
ncbi:MAG: CDP-glycerol glycerophosphotransferase family protein [Atopobiaceae bacterium]|nr:CDP-glycerol glycerophosphotransferase family protein [Atopobiaceae bacterium]